VSKVDIKKTELVWFGKYNEEGVLNPVERPGPFPLQVSEIINNPKIGRNNNQIMLYDNHKNISNEDWTNKLILGDNKLVITSLLKDFAGKINLIYIDPPFATGSDFKVKIPVGEKLEIEEKAYNDKWGKGLDSYLQMMYERLVLMKELLAENGSIYVHLDWHVAHYVKVMMDEIFGYKNMVNEVIWSFKGTTISAKMYGDKHDNILFYVKNKGKHIFNADSIRIPFSKETKFKQDENGKWYRQYLKETKKYYASQDFINGKWVIRGKYRYDVIDDVPSMITAHGYEYLGYDTQKKEDLLKIFILASSNPGDIVADFFCGSGTTLAVAEKLGRRWIGCDSSIHAINTTKKRLLEIEKSKDLMNKNNLYGKKARPFEILTLDSYERKYWQVKTFKDISDCIAFILNAYGAEPILDYTYLRGKKENALVYVGDLDSPITIQNLINAVKECKQAGGQELHILGWEWEMSLNTVIQDIAEREGIIIKPRIIPRDIMNREAVKNIRFFELSYFNVDIEIEGNQLQVELKDFIIPHKDLIPNSIKDKIEKWTDWVDYWAIDFDYKENIFNNNWTSYRTKKDRTLTLKATYKYNNPGRYKICVKVTDIFGIDTSQLFEIEIK